MKKLFMKLCGQDRKLRSSQTLKPMRVITKASSCVVETFYTEDKMTYQEWIAYIGENRTERADYPHNLPPSVKNYSSFTNSVKLGIVLISLVITQITLK